MLLASSGTSQSLEDKLYAVKYFLSGQGISYVVLKATTSELIGPKKKHLNYLVSMTHEPNVSIPNLVKHLKQRGRHPEWMVAFKAAITIHHLINYGNEKFVQNLASSTSHQQPFDKSFTSRTGFILSHNMNISLRRYWRYINSKIQTYRLLGLDFCRMEPGSLSLLDSDCRDASTLNITCNNTGTTLLGGATNSSGQTRGPNQPLSKMRNLSLKQVVKIIPILQNQFDVLLAFDASVNDLCNGVINSAFAMLYKDFVKLYIAYQAAIIRLLELYFGVSQAKLCSELLDIYKKFLTRMFEVSNFMRIVDSVGIDKSIMPNVSRAPELELETLEKHLQTLQSTPRRNYFSLAGCRMQSAELPRLDYATLTGDGRGSSRRRSLRTPTRQSSMDHLTPRAKLNYQQRADELKHLEQMLGIRGEKQAASNSAGTSNRDKSICDLIEQPEEDLLLDEPIVSGQAGGVGDTADKTGPDGASEPPGLSTNEPSLMDFSLNPFASPPPPKAPTGGPAGPDGCRPGARGGTVGEPGGRSSRPHLDL